MNPNRTIIIPNTLYKYYTEFSFKNNYTTKDFFVYYSEKFAAGETTDNTPNTVGEKRQYDEKENNDEKILKRKKNFFYKYQKYFNANNAISNTHKNL